MERRDYLLRQVELLRKLVLRFRELVQAGRLTEARTALEEDARGLGINLPLSRALTDDSLLGLLRMQSNFDGQAARLHATVLHCDAELARAEGRDAAALASARNALRLLLIWEAARGGAAPNADVDAESRRMIEQLIALLPDEALSPALRAELARRPTAAGEAASG